MPVFRPVNVSLCTAICAMFLVARSSHAVEPFPSELIGEETFCVVWINVKEVDCRKLQRWSDDCFRDRRPHVAKHFNDLCGRQRALTDADISRIAICISVDQHKGSPTWECHFVMHGPQNRDASTLRVLEQLLVPSEPYTDKDIEELSTHFDRRGAWLSLPVLGNIKLTPSAARTKVINEAISTMSNASIGIVILPNDALRRSAKQKMPDLWPDSTNSPLEKLIVAVQDFRYMTVAFRPDTPALLTISVQFPSPEKATAFQRRFDQPRTVVFPPFLLPTFLRYNVRAVNVRDTNAIIDGTIAPAALAPVGANERRRDRTQ